MTEPYKGQDLVNQVIGKTKDAATQLIEGNGYHARIVREDSESYMGTMEIDDNRIKLSIDNNIVTQAHQG